MPVRLVEPGASPGEKREIPITKDEFLIGRGADCDLRLHASAISRHHCLLRVRGEEASVADLGSSNGTFVNGQRVRSQTRLHRGDELRLGSYTFLIELGPQDGISWWREGAADQGAPTAKLSDFKRDLPKPGGESESALGD
jgi:pSer/pThr/pTyr-binding forkhead associated (FHA) protein